MRIYMKIALILHWNDFLWGIIPLGNVLLWGELQIDPKTSNSEKKIESALYMKSLSMHSTQLWEFCY